MGSGSNRHVMYLERSEPQELFLFSYITRKIYLLAGNNFRRSQDIGLRLFALKLEMDMLRRRIKMRKCSTCYDQMNWSLIKFVHLGKLDMEIGRKDNGLWLLVGENPTLPTTVHGQDAGRSRVGSAISRTKDEIRGRTSR